ncbi:MAG: phosphoglycerate kinase [Pseudomonadota bacterium]
MPWTPLTEMDLAGKTVLTRLDLNVPTDGGRITDETRIVRAAPTVKAILAAGGRPVILSHFGRPKGQMVPDLSLRFLVPALEAHIGAKVDFVERPSRELIDATPMDRVILVENTRFAAMEEANDPMMAKFLASLGDVYCNDAFSAAHRAHASTEGIAHLLPNCAGLLMAEELTALERVLSNPPRPVTAVVGGAKVSTKLDLLGNLLTRVDRIVIGGGMANTFLAAQGMEVGKSLCETDMLDTAREIMAKAGDAGCTLVLPVDVVAATQFAANADHVTVAADACPADRMILDAGPASVAAIEEVFATSKAVLWNGPLGAFEIEPFDRATVAAARKAAALTKAGTILSVAGGGDTVAALNAAGAAADFTYVSSAGGAFLEWLEGKTLPGVAALGG